MQSVIKSWLSCEGKGVLTEKLSKYLLGEMRHSSTADGANPFQSFLALIRTVKLGNRKRRNDCVRDMISPLETLTTANSPAAAAKVSPNDLSAPLIPLDDWRSRYLTNDVKLLLFKHMIEGEFFGFDLASKWVEIFELGVGDVRELVVWRVRRLLEDEEDPNDLLVATAVIAKIEAYDQVDLNALFARLLLADKIQILELFVGPSEAVQRKLLSLLDRWTNSSAMMTESECRGQDPTRKWESLPNDQLQWQRLEGKTLKKLVARLAKKFAIDSKEDFHNICPNLFRDKRFGAIRYNALEFLRNGAIDLQTFMENAEELVLKDKDPRFPESALFALTQLDQELPSNFNFDDDLICRLAVKWSVPFEDLGRNLPHIRDKVKSGNYELRETEDLGDAEEENRALFFFQFPLSEDCIILVDSISSYAAACAELLNCSSIGVDCEWPSFKGAAGVVCLLQLAVRDRVFLFDVKTLKESLTSDQWSSLACIFTSPSIAKIGYGICEDLDLLGASIPALRPSTSKQSRRNVVDLHTALDRIETLDPQLLRNYDISDAGWDRITGGLSGLVSALLGKALDKSQQRSDWDARPLRRAQRKYAALDAYVSLLLYDDFLRRILERKGQKNLFDFSFYASGKLTPAEAEEKERLQKEKEKNRRIAKFAPKQKNTDSVAGGIDMGRGDVAGATPKPISAGVPGGFYDSDDSDDFYMGRGGEGDGGGGYGGENSTKPVVCAPAGYYDSDDSDDSFMGGGGGGGGFAVSAKELSSKPADAIVPGGDSSCAGKSSRNSSSPFVAEPGSSPAASPVSDEAVQMSALTLNDSNISSTSSASSASRASPNGMGRGRSRGRARSRGDQPEVVVVVGASMIKYQGGRGQNAFVPAAAAESVDLVGQMANDEWLRKNSRADASGKLWFGRGCRSDPD